MKIGITAVVTSLIWVAACSDSPEPTGDMRGTVSTGTPPPISRPDLAVASGAPAPPFGSTLAGRGGAAGTGAPVTTPPPANPGFPGAAGMSAPPPGVAGRPGGGFPTMAGAAAPPPAGAAGAAAPPPPAGPPPDASDRSPTGVCARWKADRADIREGTWSGDVASCNAGDISADGRANALKLINLYRWLANLPPVTDDPTMNMQAQQCALLQRANNMLSHTPPNTWTCYNDVGAMASGRCNISTGPGVSSVDGYMVDPGNPTTIGHRRWILSNSFGPTGLGSTDRHSCMMTFGKMKVNKAWQAWPAPGAIPLQAMQGGFGQKVDSTGWTIQSDTINLASAMVTVTESGAAQPVMITQLGAGYGSKYAIRFNPMGWSTTAGKTYKVDVTGTTMPISYEVQIVDCK